MFSNLDTYNLFEAVSQQWVLKKADQTNMFSSSLSAYHRLRKSDLRSYPLSKYNS